MKFEVTRYSICVPLNQKQWARLMRIDHTRHLNNPRTRPTCDELDKILKDAGAESVELNGHFGRNFFFEADTLADAERITAVFESVINGTHPICAK